MLEESAAQVLRLMRRIGSAINGPETRGIYPSMGASLGWQRLETALGENFPGVMIQYCAFIVSVKLASTLVILLRSFHATKSV